MLQHNFEQVVKNLQSKSKDFETELNKGFKRGMQRFETHLIKNQLSGRRSKNYGLNKQSGNAANSLNLLFTQEYNESVGRITIGPSAWYLKVHQHHNFTGFIRPKNKQWLTIPAIPGAINRKASDFDLVFVKRPGKNPVLIGVGADAKRGVVFRLRKQVYIPKRLRFYEHFKLYGRKWIKQEIMSHLQKVGS